MPLITNVMGSSAAELRELVAACEERPEIAAIELNVSCPNVRDGPRHRRRPRAAAGGARGAARRHLQAADRQAHAQRGRRAGVRAGRRAGRSGRRLADQHAARDGARPGRATAPAREPWLGGGTGGLSGPAVRAVALAQVAAVAERVRDPGDRHGRGPERRPRARAAGGRRDAWWRSGPSPSAIPPRGAGSRASCTAGARCEQRRYFSAVSGTAAGPRPRSATLQPDRRGPLRCNKTPANTTPDRGPASMNLSPQAEVLGELGAFWLDRQPVACRLAGR